MQKLEEELEEKEEFLSTATETQDQFRNHAINYQKKYAKAKTALEAQKQENSTLKQENSVLRETIAEVTRYLKCTKDQIVEKIKSIISTNEEQEKNEWNNLMDGVNKTLASNNPKLK